MGGHRLIYDTRDLESASEEVVAKVDRALLAAAFKIRDDMREEFKKSQSSYKYGTAEYYRMAQGIMVGKLLNNQVKVHALGNHADDGTWKARFFVGGTQYRKGNPNNSNKGRIAANEAVDKGIRDGQKILETYIKNTLDN